jgi:outer membrane protein TolC
MVDHVSQPAQVPLSGATAQSGTVTSSQSTTNAGGGNSVNLINTSVNVQGDYSGSVPTGLNTGTVLPLTLAHALTLGLRYNLGQINQQNTVRQAQAMRTVARSALLPKLDAVLTESLQENNLRTLGVLTPAFPEVVTFNYFDARAGRLSQSVLDFVQWGNLRSATENVKAAQAGVRDARDQVVLAVGGTYLELIATNARIDSARAQVESSRAVNKQAADRLRSGVAARIDASRTRVQLQTDQQRLRSLQADLDRQKLTLARIIGLPNGQDFSVADEYQYVPLNDLTVAQALEEAYRKRADYEAALAGVRAAESALKAAHAERLPNISLTADWGATGLRPGSEAHSTYAVAGGITIPIYEGGRIRGDIDQAQAAVDERRAEAENLKGRIDDDVRRAFIDLNSAADQVDLALSNVSLAHDTLKQSSDRFAAGVADTVEVVQAEQAVVQADNDYISAVFEHNLAKVSLARAMGEAESGISRLLVKK